jgi:type I restriction enzyme S subunit
MVETTAKTTHYQRYKDSGVEWLGEIPEQWKVLPSKRFHKVEKYLNSKRDCDNVLSLTLRGVVNNNPDSPEGMVPKDYATYQVFDKNNLVFKLIDLENLRTSRVGIVHEKGIMSSAYIRLVIGQNSLPRFAYYYFFSLYINEVYNNLGSGVRSTLGPNDLLNIPFIKPPLEEQTAIAEFLDDKTTKIEEAITIKEQQIKLLKERKQIVIHKAVTQGLNPNVKLKDSGVEWIGEIPEHWEVSRLGLMLKPYSVKNRPNETLLSITRELGVIERDLEDLESNHNFIPEDLSGYKLIEKGDFGMNKMKAWQGSYGVSKFTGIVSPAYYTFKLVDSISPDFFHFAIRSKIYVPFFGKASDGVRIGQWDLSKERMKRIPFVIPTLDEQKEILEYIDSISLKIETAINLKQKEIEKLKEYKSSLINSVVTGKVKVC